MRLTPLALSVFLALGGCAGFGDLRQVPAPDALPQPDVTPPPERSDESLAQQAYFERLEADLVARGLLRADGGGPDTPFTDEMVARNFRAVAFSEEFTEFRGLLTARSRASTLHRWRAPIRMEVVFGETVSDEAQQKDHEEIEAYANRVSRLSGHPIDLVTVDSNFSVIVVHEHDLRRIGSELKTRLPQISDAEIAFVETLPLEAYCLVFTSDPRNDGVITQSVAIIRAELPPALRTACIHEEIAQGLGFGNDSDLARPSIFRDDDEFGRLTRHDEILLSILYDERLEPGMTETEAAPIVLDLARSRMARPS